MGTHSLPLMARIACRLVLVRPCRIIQDNNTFIQFVLMHQLHSISMSFQNSFHIECPKHFAYALISDKI
jgi:hypothetical protein